MAHDSIPGSSSTNYKHFKVNYKTCRRLGRIASHQQIRAHLSAYFSYNYFTLFCSNLFITS